ncbi:putative ABC transporter, substrate-binding protein [Clostridium neonatale]|uniref:sugar ABC transporter substrate-binding protein n=1 Tax=Clostridium neonatale TaxID=137838 RepID=UPI00291B4CAF|nr:putative ABC transporter, substrate-binding protein [Clostridium neonatale]CAI3670222.1 putative ABC transporter, substrate-binding protein [Clostridium neonatale]CAI3671001.1 putative ABC transporter, substrate-binding protein [Clostridium neonatale]CAI3671675.1 putative ABC transporter, substrate-binding protein [Clostridium neonatale]CAI3682527.1 putative ABC transporter, substrate-binding protein [Clostridium neonatale]
MIREYRRTLIAIILIFMFFIGTIGIFIYIDSDGIYSADGVENQRRIGATYMTMNNTYFKVINQEIRYIVEEQGDVLITRDPALNLDKQIEEIYDFIDMKVDAIFINTVDWIGIKPALEDAKKAGIIIIAIDTDVYDENLIDCTILSDNYNAGVECAKDLMKNSEEANIILLEHTIAKSAIDRIKGFEDTIKNNNNYKIVARSNCDGQLETAMPVVENLLAKVPDANVIMALNDPSALGAIMALEQKNIKNIKVYGIDGSPDGKRMIEDNRMTVTVAQSPKNIGRISAEKLYEIFKGNSIEKKIIVPVEIINSENIDKYKIDAWQ